MPAICLDTGEDKPDNHPSFEGHAAFEPLRRRQAKWMQKVIRQPDFKNAQYRVVFCHLPLRWKEEDAVNYEEGGFDAFSRCSREAWHDVLVEWKAHRRFRAHP